MSALNYNRPCLRIKDAARDPKHGWADGRAKFDRNTAPRLSRNPRQRVVGVVLDPQEVRRRLLARKSQVL